MHVDFSQVSDVEDFASIPPGTYVVRIAEVREGVTREGAPRWAVRLEVVDGPFAGRTAAWDGLVWSEKGLRRVKHVLDKLGFDVSGGVELDSEQLVGLEVRAEISLEEREDPLTGSRQIRPRVPFLGYASVAANGGA
jgi:hypothetical protein